MLETLEETASVWVFQSDSKLDRNQQDIATSILNNFIPTWSTHGSGLRAGFEIVNDLFIIIGADENHVKVGGCSKDSLTRSIKEIGKKIDVDFFNRLNTAFINDNQVKLVDMVEFKNLVGNNKIDKETIVFNNLITTKADLANNWRVKVENSWHINLMPIQ